VTFVDCLSSLQALKEARLEEVVSPVLEEMVPAVLMDAGSVLMKF